MVDIIKKHLPKSCYSARDIDKIDGAVIHYVSAKNITPDDPFNLDTILKIFKNYRVSAHYLIERDGTILELVPMPKRAFHAGYSIMNDRVGCNNFTLGIELVGGQGFEYTEDQIASLTNLLARLMTEYQFTYNSIEGHDVIRAAWNKKNPEKQGSVKLDPGPHFPWLDLKTSLLNVSEAINRDT